MTIRCRLRFGQVTDLQSAQQEKKNLRTAIVLATIAACFFLGFLVRRLFF